MPLGYEQSGTSLGPAHVFEGREKKGSEVVTSFVLGRAPNLKDFRTNMGLLVAFGECSTSGQNL